MVNSKYIRKVDPEIATAIDNEVSRQQNNLELIASENVISPAVMEAMGSVLSNKYAEGYPGKRFYGGCEFVDDVETIAIQRANEIYGSIYANVQAHSGSQANMAALFGLLNPGKRLETWEDLVLPLVLSALSIIMLVASWRLNRKAQELKKEEK